MWYNKWLYLCSFVIVAIVVACAAADGGPVEDRNDFNSTDVFDSLASLIPDLDLSLDKDKADNVCLNVKLGLSTRNDLINGESRKKKKSTMDKLMPMFMIPFMLQSAMIPMMLASMKFMLVKSLIVGKLALILIAINALRRTNTDNHQRLAVEHYGYKMGSSEEIGAWVN